MILFKLTPRYYRRMFLTLSRVYLTVLTFDMILFMHQQSCLETSVVEQYHSPDHGPGK